jgi:hypothetical protein
VPALRELSQSLRRASDEELHLLANRVRSILIAIYDMFSGGISSQKDDHHKTE